MDSKEYVSLLRNDESINQEILQTLLRRQNCTEEEVEEITMKVFGDKTTSISDKEHHILSDIIRYRSSSSYLISKDWGSRIRNFITMAIFFIVIGVFVWLIFDGQSRASSEFNMPPYITLIISMSIMLLLALLEGSQIAIMDIHDKDLSKASDSFSTAYDIQKIARSEDKLHKYLIGRQLLVVGIVTIFGLLTSFPNLDLSKILGISFGMGIVNLIAFKLGMINAIILLWIGQLLPQLLATKIPMTILNSRLVKFIVYLCIWISATRVASPATYAISKIKINEKKPPISDYDRFKLDSERYRHYLNLHTVYIRYTSTKEAELTSVRKYIFEGTVERIVRRTVDLGATVLRHNLSNVIGRNKNNLDFKLVDKGSNTDPVEGDDGLIHYRHVLEPQTGDFDSGDTLEIEDYFELSELEMVDIRIDRPVRILYIKCEIHVSMLNEHNLKVPKLILNEYDWDRSTEDYFFIKEITVKPVRENDFIYASYAIPFPSPDTKYALKWDINND